MGSRHSLVLLALALAAVGCAKVLGVADYRVAAPAADAGSKKIVFTDATCGACMRSGCGAELVGCEADGACRGFEACMARCTGNTDCEHRCFTTLTSTNGKMGDVAACEFEHCYDDCQATGYASAASGACGTATHGQCGAPVHTDPGVLKFERCMFDQNCVLHGSGSGVDSGESGGGANPACSLSCVDPTDASEPVSTGMDGGLAESATLRFGICQNASPTYAQCDLGYLGCVGKYGWPPASDTTNDVTVVLTDGAYPELPGHPLANVPIHACRQGIVGCNLESKVQLTGHDGRARFTLPTQLIPGGLRWFFVATPGWPEGPSSLLFDTERGLPESTVLSLATEPNNFANAKAADYQFASVGPWSTELGAIFVSARTCSGYYANGLEYRLDGGSGSIGYYGIDPTYHATPTAATNVAYIASVAPGVHEVSALKDGNTIARVNVVVQADALTLVDWLEPLSSDGQ